MSSTYDLGTGADGSPVIAEGRDEIEEAMTRVWNLTYWEDEQVSYQEWERWTKEHPYAPEGTKLGAVRLLPCVSEDDADLIRQAHTTIFSFESKSWQEWLEALLSSDRLLRQVKATNFLPLYEAVRHADDLIFDAVISCAKQIAP